MKKKKLTEFIKHKMEFYVLNNRRMMIVFILFAIVQKLVHLLEYPHLKWFIVCTNVHLKSQFRKDEESQKKH